MKDYLFVYGTLAKEIAPREIAAAVKKLKDIGQGFILGRLYDIGEYPGAVLNGGPQDKIFGKIYQLPGDPAVLDRLDKYEGFDPAHPSQSAFVRRRTSISRPNKTTLKAWVYEYNRDVSSQLGIKDGQYSKVAGWS
jgi:gamma-glutamylcyclotransferase (GGCT)/AIG2-like uncharacterized protein YtfP